MSKNKIAKLNKDYEASKAELEALMQQKLINEAKVNGMKSDLDFLKGLEAKQMSLKLLNATMTSDLIFEETNKYKKSNGAFFKYTHKTQLDLSRYQIFNKLLDMDYISSFMIIY